VVPLGNLEPMPQVVADHWVLVLLEVWDLDLQVVADHWVLVLLEVQARLLMRHPQDQRVDLDLHLHLVQVTPIVLQIKLEPIKKMGQKEQAYFQIIVAKREALWINKWVGSKKILPILIMFLINAKTFTIK
jgi:hypothetical protein